ncbi:hypothetical protein F2Q68_00022362 [Brassica cretica]|uniref:Uncharacterized protein n=1 Tax=Brassica cretica TaxID=69181 RepID=A0A8S9FZI0_BRACR|nr:hypothetical protein F2Q68_00022362 [Brassica cretica]
MKLLHARLVANNVSSAMHYQKRHLHLLEPPLKLVTYADQLVRRRGARPRHRPPRTSHRELPLPRLLEGNIGNRSASGDDAPGRDKIRHDEEQMLQRPRRFELRADSTHGAVEDESVPDASLTERDVERDGSA